VMHSVARVVRHAVVTNGSRARRTTGSMSRAMQHLQQSSEMPIA